MSLVQVLVCGSRTFSLDFDASQSLSVAKIKQGIAEKEGIPVEQQWLSCNAKYLNDRQLFSATEVQLLPPLHLSLRVFGGKGGFGSLLRGGNSKVGQKKTTNFDACRDLSGRRLRHQNNEKRLAEWYAEEKERELEKIAEEHIKGKEKEKKQHVFDVVAYNEELDAINNNIASSVEVGVSAATKETKAGAQKKAAVKEKASKFDSLFSLKRKRTADKEKEESSDSSSDSEEEGEKGKEKATKKQKVEKPKAAKGKEKKEASEKESTLKVPAQKAKKTLPPPPEWIAC